MKEVIRMNERLGTVIDARIPIVLKQYINLESNNVIETHTHPTPNNEIIYLGKDNLTEKDLFALVKEDGTLRIYTGILNDGVY